MNSLKELLFGGSRTVGDVRERLPRSVISHDVIDEWRWEDLVQDSPAFREHTIEDPPTFVVGLEAPTPVDPLTATQDEIEQYRKDVYAFQQAKGDAKPYPSYDELCADVFYGYHADEEPKVLDKVDVGVELHREIMEQVLSSEEWRETWELTRGDDMLSAYATVKFMDTLKDVLGDKLEDRAKQAQELEEAREEAETTQVLIDEIVPPAPPTPEGEQPPAPEPGEEGQPGEGGAPGGTPTGGTATAGGGQGGTPVEVKLTDKAKQELADLEAKREEAHQRAEELAEQPGLDREQREGVGEAAQAGEEAAQAAASRPGWGQGLHAGEPTYTSQEQAFEITRRWAEIPELRKMCELMGRMARFALAKRSKRIEGGNDEIVDVQTGDDLQRTIPAELALLADEATTDDFLARFVEKDVLEYQTVGEENAGRGPVVVVLDGSGSMGGERNIYARAVAMTVLQLTRQDKRDYALIEFSGGGQIKEWFFRARDPLMGEQVIDMASHFFGGGTVPILGTTRAAEIMRQSPEFKKADVILIGDGEATFGDDDRALRDELTGLGVRFFAIAIGGSWNYLKSYCEPDGFVVDVHDFQLNDATGDAVEQIATRMT